MLLGSSLSFAFYKIPNENWDSVVDSDEYPNIHQLVYERFQDVLTLGESEEAKLTLDWPLKDPETSILTRFGTPTILQFDGINGLVYTHEAIDIKRSNPSLPDSVYSPVSGLAIVVKERGEESDYSTTVAILDDHSKIIISLLHLKTSLSNLTFTQVKKGDFIGNLAFVEPITDPLKQEIFKHTHLALINPDTKKMVNPIKYLHQYFDTIKPEITSLSLFNEKGSEISRLESGKLDVVAKGFDRDNMNDINFETREVTADIKDQNGNLLYQLLPCNLDFLTSSIIKKNFIKDAFYLDFLAKFTNDDFGGILTNATVNDREFSYVLTNLKRDSDSCELLSDDEGYLYINDSVQFITIKVVFTDDFGNSSLREEKITR